MIPREDRTAFMAAQQDAIDVNQISHNEYASLDAGHSFTATRDRKGCLPDSRPPEAGDWVLGCIRPARRCGSARLGSDWLTPTGF